jgi:hypothetical protein
VIFSSGNAWAEPPRTLPAAGVDVFLNGEEITLSCLTMSSFAHLGVLHFYVLCISRMFIIFQVKKNPCLLKNSSVQDNILQKKAKVPDMSKNLFKVLKLK